MPVIDKLAWIHIDGARLLCARSRGKDAWFLPGGKREPGESDAAALAREIQEELSVRLRVDSLEPVGVFEAPAHGQTEGVTVRLTCFAGAFDGELRPSAEIEEIGFMGIADRERISVAGQVVLDWLAARGRVS